MPDVTHRRPAPRLRAGLAGLALILAAGARDLVDGTPAASVSDVSPTTTWRSGQAVPIAAIGGHARFTVPTPNAGARTLVVVSSLARGAATYPIRVVTRDLAGSRVEAPALAIPERATPPELRIPKRAVVPPPSQTAPHHARTFHLMVRDGDAVSASNYLAVPARLRAVGARVQVYIDERDDATVSASVVRDVVETFDAHVFPHAARTIGLARDVDGDGRFTVLMSGWLTRLGGGRHAVDGFVRGTDLETQLPAPFSNHCDMMYLSSALEAGPHLKTVIAHEYTHAVTFTAKSLAAALPGQMVASEEEGWLDEALAHLVEDQHGFSRSNLDYRVSAFLSSPERYRLVVEDYYAADLFRSHGNRGGTYLFLRWCADRFGPALIPALIGSGRQGVANLEAATGVAFADLYRAWSVALFTSGLDPARPDRDAFRSVDVRGAFDAWELAGPRTQTVAPGESDSWTSCGTASRYLVIGASRSGAVSIEIDAPAEAGLQVTALPLPDDLAALDLAATATIGVDGAPGLDVTIHERNGTPVRLSALAWEPLIPGPNPHAPSFRRGGLDSSRLSVAFGAANLTPFGKLTARSIPAQGAFEPRSGPVIVKLIGTDSRGRRIAAWAEVERR